MTKGIAEIVREMREAVSNANRPHGIAIFHESVTSWADHLEAVQTPTEERGTFACSVCGKSEPHYHNTADVNLYRWQKATFERFYVAYTHRSADWRRNEWGRSGGDWTAGVPDGESRWRYRDAGVEALWMFFKGAWQEISSVAEKIQEERSENKRLTSGVGPIVNLKTGIAWNDDPRTVEYRGAEPVADGEWLRPAVRDFLMVCCDCGLVHRVNFRVLDKRAELQAFRDDDLTAKERALHADRYSRQAPSEEAVQTPQEEKWEGPFANPEHDPGECGCENHSPWCPYNPHASEINPYPLPPSGSAVQTPPTEKDPL